ncbi:MULTISPECIES: MFS transporter [Gordonibacter]|uniref:MFS transporter n=1 Tax=Gordonibacter faecis TaxID=3047475 RepID=A0ABT7DLP6_9ACTN|nr:MULTISPECIES: MFS transporter [unclassified Gordonibacter]MDJ1650458.1 MFS transporter [Gordonibacter sp. KGMB12511]HIW76911.1 MFS transporter [Candidatus Gordonibacter avicola]
MPDLTIGQIKSKRMLYLALSTLTLLFLGLIYAFSMFAAPICTTFGLEKSAVGLTFNIMMITFCIGAVIGSQIERKIGVRNTLFVAAVMFFCGFAGTGLFGNGSIAVVYGCYGVLGGLGVGIGYNSVIATTNIWFPDKVGFSSGVLMMGFGLGSLILGTLSVNLAPSVGLGTVFTAIGVVTALVVVVLACTLRRPPENIVALMAPEKATSSGYDPGDQDAPLKTGTFYVYWIWAIIVIAIGLATIGNCASDAQLVGLDAAFATLLVGLVSTCNGLARVVIGLIYDKTNVKVTMLVDGLIAVAACACIIGALTTGVSALYVVGAFCCGFCYGGVPVVASAFARQRFGAKNYPLNLSLANFAIVFGSILNIIVQGAVGGADNRLAVFMVMGVLSLVAALDVLPFSKKWNSDLKMLESRKAQASSASSAQAGDTATAAS